MAFVHHPRSKPARDRQAEQSYHEHQPYTRPNLSRSTQSQAQDWSIVFPGKSREQGPEAQVHTDSASSASNPSLDPFDGQDEQVSALTLPPLHDGTGRFAGESDPSVSAPSSPIDEIDVLQSPLSPRSDVYSESVFSLNDSHADADEEVGFGSGSDFESDAVASIPSHSSNRCRTQRARRASRLSGASGREDVVNERDALAGSASAATSSVSMANISTYGSTIGDSRAWSWLSGTRSRAEILDRVPESASSSSYLTTSKHSQRGRRNEKTTLSNALPVVFTSDSEGEDQGRDVRRYQDEAQHHLFEADMASSQLAQSAGLGAESDPSLLLRRPKRRHRQSALGRSSKRSNTSQSQSVLGREAGSQQSFAVLSASSAQRPGRPRTKASVSVRSTSSSGHQLVRKKNTSMSKRMVGKLLRKLFDLEPGVLDAFMQDDSRSQQQPHHHRPTTAHMPSIGFALEQGVNDVPCPMTGVRLLIDGREVEYLEEEEEDAADGTLTPRVDERNQERIDLALARSPLFDLTKTVPGEVSPSGSFDSTGLTSEALSRRRAPSSASQRYRSKDSASMLEPTTIEALQALVSSVIPVPMPFRILGALVRSLGWTGIWGSTHEMGSNHSWSSYSTSSTGDGAEMSDVESEQDRRYRYDRLLSAQQAKEWSRRYRGIQLANDVEDETSMDVPTCWGGNEHPALAGEATRL